MTHVVQTWVGLLKMYRKLNQPCSKLECVTVGGLTPKKELPLLGRRLPLFPLVKLVLFAMTSQHSQFLTASTEPSLFASPVDKVGCLRIFEGSYG
jgi:hypothetical protein